MTVRLTYLVDDYCTKAGLLGEHGLAILLEAPGGNVLVDTGLGLAIAYNASVLGIDFSKLDAVAITHGHNDHAGGLKVVLEQWGKGSAGSIPVCAHPGVFHHRVKKDEKGKLVDTGIPFTQEELEKSGARFVFNTEPTQLVPGIMFTGEIERGFAEIKTRSHFVYQNGDLVPDPFMDDQAAIVETDKGLCIVLGCAHAGVVNTLNHVAKITGEQSFYGLFGGTHLLQAGEEQLQETLAAIEDRNIQVLSFSHCTGIGASAFFARNFSGTYYQGISGFSIEL